MFGRHEDHPGHSALGCELQITVNRAPCGSSSNGYACSATGGHCVPGDDCAARRGDPAPPAKAIKLSSAQLKLLQEERGSFVEGYKPGLKLQEHGLIAVVPGGYGNCTWEITEAGRAHLRRLARR